MRSAVVPTRRRRSWRAAPMITRQAAATPPAIAKMLTMAGAPDSRTPARSRMRVRLAACSVAGVATRLMPRAILSNGLLAGASSRPKWTADASRNAGSAIAGSTIHHIRQTNSADTYSIRNAGRRRCSTIARSLAPCAMPTTPTARAANASCTVSTQNEATKAPASSKPQPRAGARRVMPGGRVRRDRAPTPCRGWLPRRMRRRPWRSHPLPKKPRPTQDR